MRTAIISVTTRGALLGQTIREKIEESSEHQSICYEKEGRGSGSEAVSFQTLGELLQQLWRNYDRLLFIMATGIVVRMIAPYILHKSVDPAVVTMDEKGQFAISLLSGHLGGANEWAAELAALTEAVPVITTATDVNGLPAPDVLARKLHLTVEDFTVLKHINAAVVAGIQVPYYIDDSLVGLADYIKTAKDYGVDLLPVGEDVLSEKSLSSGAEDSKRTTSYRVVITDQLWQDKDASTITLLLRPKTMTVGIGCRRGTSAEVILEAVQTSLQKLSRSPKSVLGAASVTVKADEAGLLEAMKQLGWPITFYEPAEMAAFIGEAGLHESEFVKDTIGVGNVCETTALLLANSQTLLQKKTIYPRTTVAVARGNWQLSDLDQVMKRL